MLSMTYDEWQDVRRRYPVQMDDVSALDYVCDLLQAEIDATEIRYPEYSDVYLSRLRRELGHLHEFSADIIGENFEEL